MPIPLLACVFSPKLYRIYSRSSFDALGEQIYQSNLLERCADFGVAYAFPAGMVFTVWTRKLQYILYLSVVLISSYALRAVGRAFNPAYVTFLRALQRATKEANTENMEVIRKYDFEFKGWPVTFTSTKLSQLARQSVVDRERGLGHFLNPCWLASWVLAHTAGIRLVYPGLLIGPMLRNYLEEAREKFVVQNKGVRAKIVTADGNSIDTMFFDRRRELDVTRGRTLVVCCEGNAGFYEIGMAGTPIAEGYSVLGWNHPGFGGSTGTPYPLEELNSAEAVFDYATNSLGFKEEDIVFYGWSIGGFPATYLAAQHPGVRGLILDATFDDILPLALPRMPGFASPLVRATIRYHIDLRVSKEILGYRGPVRLIRRTDDEIIADPPAALNANRGNFLVIDIIRQRYPMLLEAEESEKALREWLNNPHAKDAAARTASDLSELVIPANISSLSTFEKVQLTLKIADKLVTDYKSTHCTPLPGDHFIMPWNDRVRSTN